MKKRVFVGLSGGVDSAVSAALLQRAGFDVTGVFIRIVLPGYPCPAVEDRQEAMRVAAHLRIPFREIDLSKEYKEKVFEHSLAEFSRGRTPNPDTLCNKEVKFGLFFEYAMAEGADFVATGHYAQVRTVSPETRLLMGKDPTKDQSYFLWMVPERQLSRALLPVGGMLKSEVRKLANKFGLPNAKRKDSQGLCFLGDVSLTDMLEQELHPAPGDVISEQGESIGTHDGAMLYTLGQRHGFTVLADSSEERKPQYVIDKDIVKNTITVSEYKFPQGSQQTEVSLTEVNWIGNVESGEYLARFRYRQTLIPCRLSIQKDDIQTVTLLSPQYVPLGQSLVLYSGERCLGGGVVDKSTLK